MELWGLDVPEWINAISTGAGVIVAVAAVRMAKQANAMAKEANELNRKTAQVQDYMLNMEKARHEQERRKEEEGQARKISTWVAASYDYDENKKQIFKHVGIVIQNLSDEPVYGVRIASKCQFPQDNPAEAATLYLDLLPPGIYYCKSVKTGRGADFVKKDEKAEKAWERLESYSEFSSELKPITDNKCRCVDSMTFQDVSGRVWRKWKNGTMEQA